MSDGVDRLDLDIEGTASALADPIADTPSADDNPGTDAPEPDSEPADDAPDDGDPEAPDTDAPPSEGADAPETDSEPPAEEDSAETEAPLQTLEEETADVAAAIGREFRADPTFLTGPDSVRDDSPQPTPPPPRRNPPPPRPKPTPVAAPSRERAQALGLRLEEYDEALKELWKERLERAKSHNLQGFSTLTAEIAQVQRAREEQAKLNLQSEYLQKIAEEKQELMQEIEAFDQKTQTLLRELVENNQQQRAALERQQEDELKENDELWGSETKVRQYGHASGRLIGERTQLAGLLHQGKFEEAELLQRSIDRLEKAEQTAAQAALQRDYEVSVRKLGEKHENEIALLVTQNALRQTHFLQRRARERDSLLAKQ
jgi:hypothetical protein